MTEIKEHPILINALMVRALLGNRKTQTRRPIKPQPYRPASAGGRLVVRDSAVWWTDIGYEPLKPIARCPFGVSGDHLWVRETWATRPIYDNERPSILSANSPIYYGADDAMPDFEAWKESGNWKVERWRPSIHMPRWASRITLEVARVWIEQVQDITEADAKAEGAMHITPSAILHKFDPTPIIGYRAGFRELWDSFYIKRSLNWSSNPWVWVVEFAKLEAQ